MSSKFRSGLDDEKPVLLVTVGNGGGGGGGNGGGGGGVAGGEHDWSIACWEESVGDGDESDITDGDDGFWSVTFCCTAGSNICGYCTATLTL